ncbi:MAG: LytTR family DNA-binding domain-containing protein [Melioribacteraceae bacterium]|nr:LytTR family DNA-binding domain-containing protein [Melioribacteraceae bacterium]
MNKLRTIIIDDEKLAREIVKNYCSKIDEIEIIDECSNGFDGIKSININKPDLIFLDIQMPKLNGFEMLEILEEKPKIIFTTAFDQYALKAFEVNAIDYLLKPFSEERFADAVNKVTKEQLSTSDEKVEKLKSHLEEELEFLDRVIVKQNQKINIIPIDKVIYFEAQDDYVMIHTLDGKYLKQKTMKYFEDHLDPKNFVRIHRSNIVNISFIKEIELYDSESYRCVLKDNTKLSVSRSGYTKLKEILE